MSEEIKPSQPSAQQDKSGNSTPVSLSHTHTKHMAPALGSLILLLVVILVGLYLWGAQRQRVAEQAVEIPIVNNEPETPRAVADQQITETTSPSDDISAIEADINSTVLDSMDADITAIDAELGTTNN